MMPATFIRPAGSNGFIDAAQPTRAMHAAARVILCMSSLYRWRRARSVQNSTPRRYTACVSDALGSSVYRRIGRQCRRLRVDCRQGGVDVDSGRGGGRQESQAMIILTQSKLQVDIDVQLAAVDATGDLIEQILGIGGCRRLRERTDRKQ